MSVDQAQHAIVVNIIPAKYCSMTKKCVGLPAELACTATHCGKGSTASVDTIAKKKSREEPVTNISIVKYQNIRKKSVLTIHCACTLQEAAGPAVDKYLSDDNGLLAAFE